RRAAQLQPRQRLDRRPQSEISTQHGRPQARHETVRYHLLEMELNTHRWGDGDTRVLLIHGICSSGATWWAIAAGIENATVVAPDLRGHGESPRANDYSAAAFAEDLGSGWDLVIGHSLGGLIAVHAAAHDAGFAKRLILLDPVLDLDDFDAVTQANVD